MVGHGTGAIEVAKTVLEVADVAWTAIESHQHHCQNHHHDQKEDSMADHNRLDKQMESLRSENRRLRSLLEQNIRLLENLSVSPEFPNGCPADLYARLVDTVDSNKFLSQLKTLSQVSADGTAYGFPFQKATDADFHAAELLINVDLEEPSWWVWVTDDMVPSTVEEMSGIDDESYIIVSEEHVVEGVANFMARCILSNPEAEKLSPEELQKNITVDYSAQYDSTLCEIVNDALSKALGGMNKFEKMLHIWHAGKMFYALSTWGLAFAGLYRSRAFIKLAAKGVHTTGKLVLRAL